VAPSRGHESWAEHWELIDAVEAGDESRAAEIARKHTERTRSAYHEPPGGRRGRGAGTLDGRVSEAAGSLAGRVRGAGPR
jgi:hypothetical protein